MGISVSPVGETMRHPIVARMPTDYAKLLFLSFVFAVMVGCGSPDEATSGQQRFDKDFETAVASDRDYDIYWMGSGFAVGDHRFSGPEVSDFGSEITGGGLKLEYISRTPTNCCGDLEITLYSENAWALAERRRSGSPNPDREYRDITVAGRSATLITFIGSTIPINGQRVVMQIGRTHVEIHANGRIPLNLSDPQPNPLIDEATFLATVENLRPYPE